MAFRKVAKTRKGGFKITVKPQGDNSTAIVFGKGLLAQHEWEPGDRVDVLVGEGDEEGQVMIQRSEEGERKITTTASAMVTLPKRTFSFLDPELKHEPEFTFDEEEDAFILDFTDVEGVEITPRNTKGKKKTATKVAGKRKQVDEDEEEEEEEKPAKKAKVGMKVKTGKK